MARIAPIAIASLIARTAVGRRPGLPGVAERGDAAVDGGRADDDDLVLGTLDAGARPARSGSRAAAGRRRRPRPVRRGRGPSIARISDVAVAELEEMARGRGAPPSSSTSTEARSPVASESTSDHRQAGPADLVDLGVVAVSPIATTPSTVARSIARESEPWRGEMKWRP